MTLTNAGNINLYIPQGCLYFAGGISNEFIIVPDSSYFEPTDNLTLAVWMKPGTNTTDDVLITYDAGFYDWCIKCDDTDATKYEVIIDGGTPVEQTGTLDNNWHHLTLTFDKSLASQNIKFYIDGVLDNTGDDTGAIGYTTDVLTIAAKTNAGVNEWSGYINDIKFFSGNTLSGDEVKQLYNGINISDGLVAHWKFDEKKGSRITDEIYSITGTIACSPTWTDRDIKCWGSRWDESNYEVILEIFINACDRNYIADNITPGACRELYNILGTPKFIDTTFTSSNTLVLQPLGNYGLSSLRSRKVIGVKNFTSELINQETYGIKIEGIKLE